MKQVMRGSMRHAIEIRLIHTGCLLQFMAGLWQGDTCSLL